MRVEVVIDSALRLEAESVPRDVLDELKAEFTHANPAYHKALRYARWTKEPKQLVTWAREGSELVLPRGGAKQLVAVLASRSIRPCFLDRRSSGRADWRGKIPPHRQHLWQHQAEIIEAARRRENALARAPTGSGKSSAGIGFVAAVNLPSLIMVYDKALARQWIDRLAIELGIPPHEVGMIGDGKFKLRPVTIGMQQSLLHMSAERWAEVNATFGVLLVDEVQRAAASTFVEVIGRSEARFRLGISADETRKDRKEALTYDLFGDVAVDVSFDHLVGLGLVHDVEIVAVPTSFDAPWYKAQRQDEEERPDFKRLTDEMMADDPRNMIAAKIGLAEVGLGRQVVFFSQRREHAQRLNAFAAASGIRSGSLLGGGEGKDDEHEYVRTVAALRSGEVRWASGTLQAAGVGLDIPAASRGVVCTPLNNRQAMNQVRGRLCRKHPGKNDARLYYLWDRSIYGLSILKNLSRWFNNVWVAEGDTLVEARGYVAAQESKKATRVALKREGDRDEAKRSKAGRGFSSAQPKA